MAYYNHNHAALVGDKLRRRFRFVRYGVNMLALYWVLRYFLRPDGVNIENILIALILIFACMAFYLQIYFGIRRKETLSRLDGVSRLLVYFLLLVCAITILRGITLDVSRLITLLVNPLVGGVVWLLPLAILLGSQKGLLESLMPTFKFHALLSTVFASVAIGLLLSGMTGSIAEATARSAAMLLYAAPFVLLAGIGSRKYRRVFLLGLMFMLVVHLLLVNRTHFAVSLFILLFVFAVGNARNVTRIFVRTAAAIVISLPVLFVAFDYMAVNTPESWLVDTRSFLYEELMLDFSVVDMFVGRGALGGYYSPYFYNLIEAGIEGGDDPFRQVVESGYLHLLLKAGVLGVVGVVALLLRAIIVARNNDDVRVGIGVMVFLSIQLAVMVVGLHLSFEPFQILMWLLVGFSLTQHRRQLKPGMVK